MRNILFAALGAVIAIPIVYAVFLLANQPSAQQLKQIEQQQAQIRELERRERQRLAEQEQLRIREAERQRNIARSPECPGIYRQNAITITEQWTALPSKPGVCDFAIEHAGKLDFKHNDETLDVLVNQRQLHSVIPTHARSKQETVTVGYLLCPLGMGPIDASWECRTRAPSVSSGVVDAIFGRR